ncbi:MAG: right-handed parallel beta-helix repeat-containing protein [Saprospiraceae bacterium]|nr:right-handed parallel beta-helix repeat-containing protein [Saprospiraceae bacterium]
MLRLLLFALVLQTYFHKVIAQADMEKLFQTQLIMAEDGSTVQFPEGKFQLSNTLWLDGKKNITLRGAGQGKTTLSFLNQKQGAEGIKITNAQNIVIEQLTVEDAKGDLIKTQQVKGLDIRDVTAQWTGEPKASNGSYALYPVQCSLVRIERCTAIGASDAGIYVGQSDSVWVTDCVAKWNVAGVEIENTTNAWVWKNKAYDNTGGILVFDLPDLPKKSGGNVFVYDNLITRNNYRNFAPPGNIVGKVPPGTGVMILATNGVEVYHNKIWDNKTASTAIVSYYITETPIKDKDYIPYPSRIYIHDNLYSMGKRKPTWKHQLGFILWWKFGKKVPHILYDGIQNPDWLDADGELKPGYEICIQNNENGTFANIRVDKLGLLKGKISKNKRPYDCRF